MSFKSFNGRDNCFYCERKFSFNRFGGFSSSVFIIKTEDHIIATSKGGINSKLNTVVCCEQCNCLKADLTLPEFIEKIKSLIFNGETFKNIPKYLLPKMIVKAEELKLYADNKGDKLLKKTDSKQLPVY